MKFHKRLLSPQLLRAAREYPAVVLTGPRRTGKTCLLQHLFPKASYHLLEDPDLRARVAEDPQGWLDSVTCPAILDEIQNTPELFPYIRSRIDQDPRGQGRPGSWMITGSQEFAFMQGVTESMAGRSAILGLLPLSIEEIGPRWNLVKGGFPEVVFLRRQSDLWYRSYIQTYLERDVRTITDVKDLPTFRKFLSLLAARSGSVLNKSEIAGPLGVSVPTIGRWLGILETSGQIFAVPPYFENFSKRLIKSSRYYWNDTGLVCHLLGILNQKELERSPFVGALYENLVGSEIRKKQSTQGKRPELYFFRDEQGLEVDFLVPGPAASLRLVEVKWNRTPTPKMANPMQRLAEGIGRKRKVECYLVHPIRQGGAFRQPLARGVTALSLEAMLKIV